MSPELNYALKLDYTLKMVIFEVKMKKLIFLSAWQIGDFFLACGMKKIGELSRK